jgi:hypothetical protein
MASKPDPLAANANAVVTLRVSAPTGSRASSPAARSATPLAAASDAPALTTPATASPLASPPPPPPPPPPALRFPIGWLLDHGAPPIQYRAIADVARLEVPAAANIPYSYRPALALAAMQQSDGGWGRTMLSVPSARAEHFEGIGTISAVRRLLEYGWHGESPPLLRVRRLLFRLLAEDTDPTHLFEFAPTRTKINEEMARRGRSIVREAAASALAQAGYEADPRLRGAARRILERINAYLKSPLAQKPWVRVGNRQVLALEAAPPSIYALTMLAHMPSFRSEHHEHMERLYTFLTQPLPRQESVQIIGTANILQPHLVLGDLFPHRNAVEADIPMALYWIELMARLGFLRRNEIWTKMFERFVDDMDRTGVWHPRKGLAMPRSANPYVWPMFPLEEHSAGEERWADVTMRIGVIARAAGRPIQLL